MDLSKVASNKKLLVCVTLLKVTQIITDSLGLVVNKLKKKFWKQSSFIVVYWSTQEEYAQRLPFHAQ